MNNENNYEKTVLSEMATETNDPNMPEKGSARVNLLEMVAADSMESPLERVKLGSDETAMIPFTADGETIDLHYCNETEISGYVICNGHDCLLCRVGRKKDQKLLIPIYLPSSSSVGILMVGRSLRPYALLPQIANVLKADTPMVMFVTRDGGKYTVSTTDLQKDVESGEMVIKRFLDHYEANRYDFASLFQKLSNQQLANVEDIARIMPFKGISRDDVN